MAKKVVGYIKLQIPGGKATPAPPVGPALGQHGVNIVEFTKQFNARTADKVGLVIPSNSNTSFARIVYSPTNPSTVAIFASCIRDMSTLLRVSTTLCISSSLTLNVFAIKV